MNYILKRFMDFSRTIASRKMLTSMMTWIQETVEIKKNNLKTQKNKNWLLQMSRP
jgi:hypothetical protein